MIFQVPMVMGDGLLREMIRIDCLWHMKTGVLKTESSLNL